MTPKAIIAGFTDPETLLRHCRLKVFGAPGGAPANGNAPIKTWKVTVEDRDVIGFTTGRSGEKGKTKHRAYASITFVAHAPSPAPADDELIAYYVPMVQTSDVMNGNSHYVLPTAGGPDVMVTSQLTGCRFSIGSDANGATLVSHIQPNTTLPQTVRQGDLAFQSAHGFVMQGGAPASAATFGGTYDMASKVTVIGVRKSGVWQFYQQETNDPGLAQQQIKSVTPL